MFYNLNNWRNLFEELIWKWENSKKPHFRNFGTHFGPLGPNLVPKHFFRAFYLHLWLDIVKSYNRMQCQGKMLIQTQENGKKPHFGANLGWSGRLNLFFKNLASSVTRYHGQLSSVTISEKLMIQSWENSVTDGQTTESDFKGPSLINVVSPTYQTMS